MLSSLARRFFEELEAIPTVDGHEHLPPEEERLGKKLDVLYLFTHYTKSDLFSAGLTDEMYQNMINTDIPLDERWEKFKPYWEKIRYGAYARSVLITVKDLFGIEDINDDTYQEISEKLNAVNKKGWYRTLLKEKCNIAIALNNIGRTDIDKKLFAPVMFVNEFVDVRDRDMLLDLEKRYNTSIHSLDDLLRVAEMGVERWKREEAVAIKCAHAYSRIIDFDKVTHYEAEKLFNKLFLYKGEGISWSEAKPLQDHIVHKMIQIATANDMTVVFHTGLHNDGMNILPNANPTHLTNIFLEYRNTRFDLFHGGLPYIGEAGTMGKYFPNVYLSMAWMHLMSPVMSRRALQEWLDLVPAHKIIGFGGDYSILEKVYGHLKMAREDIAQVLADRVEEGYMNEKQAIKVAKWLMHDNACEWYKLEV